MKPHVRLAVSFFLIVLPIAVPISGAQTDAAELESAIALHKTGDYQQAKNQLQAAVKRRKKDPVAWHYLGLTLEALDEKHGAGIAHEHAATLGETLLISRLKRVKGGEELKTLAPISTELESAAKSAVRYLDLNPTLSVFDAEQWNNRRSALLDVAAIFIPATGDAEKKVFLPKQITTKARIIRKSEPMYTDAARRYFVRGTVVLYLTLAGNGTVRSIIPIKTLSHGLTEEAARVAREIEFTPAQVDGRPVSVIIRVEYSFDVFMR